MMSLVAWSFSRGSSGPRPITSARTRSRISRRLPRGRGIFSSARRQVRTSSTVLRTAVGSLVLNELPISASRRCWTLPTMVSSTSVESCWDGLRAAFKSARAAALTSCSVSDSFFIKDMAASCFYPTELCSSATVVPIIFPTPAGVYGKDHGDLLIFLILIYSMVGHFIKHNMGMVEAMAAVLVVEDIANIRKFISINLRASGYEVLEASRAEEAVAQFGQSPSAIVLDLALPGTDGWQLLSMIANDANVSSVPVVLTTATVLGEGERYRYRSIVDVLLKPFSAEQLVETVARAVAKYPLPTD